MQRRSSHDGGKGENLWHADEVIPQFFQVLILIMLLRHVLLETERKRRNMGQMGLKAEVC